MRPGGTPVPVQLLGPPPGGPGIAGGVRFHGFGCGMLGTPSGGLGNTATEEQVQFVRVWAVI